MKRVLIIAVCLLSCPSIAISADGTVREAMQELHRKVALAHPGTVQRKFVLTPLVTGTELVRDGGFEDGWAPSGKSGSSGVSGAWTWSQSGGVLNPIWWDYDPALSSPGDESRTGGWCVYFNPFGANTNRLYQAVSIPAGATASLSFWLKVGTFETSSIMTYDTLRVGVTDTSGGLLTTLHTYSNLDDNAGFKYVQHSFDVSAYAGRTVRVQFDSYEDATNPTIFLLDDVSLVATVSGTTCTEDAYTMCLIGGRYKVTSQWKNQYAGGVVSTLNKATLTDATGAFWLSDNHTYEYLIRMNTATDNGKAWVAIPTFTDVEFWITVEDVTNGQSKTYHSPAGNRTLIFDPNFFIYP